MTDSTAADPAPKPPRIPGDVRLAHPPSDRYRAAEPPAVAEATGSTAGAVTFAIGAALAGAAAIVLFGGVLAVSAGLLVVAAATGWIVAVGLRIGAGHTMPPGRRLAVGLAGFAVVLGQIGLWLFARSEGGVLGPLDYLGETFGLLVPLQLAAASIGAWLAAR